MDSISNDVLQERIESLQGNFTGEMKKLDARLGSIEGLLRQLRDDQMVIAIKLDSVTSKVNEHEGIIGGQNHGLNKPGIVSIVTDLQAGYTRLSKAVNELREMCNTPQRIFWKWMDKVASAALVFIALGILAKLLHM